MRYHTNIPHGRERGFTLLLATLTASLLLILGSAIFGLIRKEVILSSLGRDSQFAFYAADTSAECALYMDIRHSVFTTGTTTARCDEQLLGTIPVAPIDGSAATFEYQPNGLCARVSVSKKSTNPHTIIDARGYNTTCAQIGTNPRALERAVEIFY